LNDAYLEEDSVDSAFAFVRKTINQVPPVTACPRNTNVLLVRRKMLQLRALVLTQPLYCHLCDAAVLSPAWQRRRSEVARGGRPPPSRPNLKESRRLPARYPWSNLSTGQERRHKTAEWSKWQRGVRLRRSLYLFTRRLLCHLAVHTRSQGVALPHLSYLNARHTPIHMHRCAPGSVPRAQGMLVIGCVLTIQAFAEKCTALDGRARRMPSSATGVFRSRGRAAT
jgi:hypothetical protein